MACGVSRSICATARWRPQGHTEIVNAPTGRVLRFGTAFLEEVEWLRGGVLDVGGAASRVAVPWLIVHGTGDETIAAEDAERPHRMAGAGRGRAELELVEGANLAFDIRHSMSAPSSALDRAVRRTVSFFVTRLG